MGDARDDVVQAALALAQRIEERRSEHTNGSMPSPSHPADVFYPLSRPHARREVSERAKQGTFPVHHPSTTASRGSHRLDGFCGTWDVHNDNMNPMRNWNTEPIRQRSAPCRERTLLERKKEYDAHKEALRRQRSLEELATVRAIPQTNTTSTQRNRSSTDVAERLLRYGEAKRCEHEVLRIQREHERKDHEEESFTGSPMINEQSRSLDRSNVVDSLYSWENLRHEKQRAKRQELVRQDLQEVQRKPQLSSNTLRITANAGRRGAIEKRLLVEGERSRKEVARRQKEVEHTLARPGPSLHLTQNYVPRRGGFRDTNGSIHERLYKLSALKREEEERDHPQNEPFHPRINLSSRALTRSGAPIEDRLQQKGEEYRVKKELLRKEQDPTKDMRSRPALTPGTQSVLEYLEGVTSVEKDPVRPWRSRAVSSMRRDARPEKPSFRPTLNKHSVALDQRTSPSSAPSTNLPPRISRLLDMGHKYEAKRAQAITQHHEARESSQPQTESSARSFEETFHHAYTPSKTLIERWNERSHRLQVTREEYEREQHAKEMSECTFAPELYRVPHSLDPSLRTRLVEAKSKVAEMQRSATPSYEPSLASEEDVIGLRYVGARSPRHVFT